jgi:hypothetical protein
VANNHQTIKFQQIFKLKKQKRKFYAIKIATFSKLKSTILKKKRGNYMPPSLHKKT